MKLVPKRRFAGFTDFWEQRRLGDLGDTFTGLSGKTKEDFGKGDAEFIPYLNVLNNPISDITFTEKVEVDKKQNEVMFGDIFFTTSSETAEEVGMSSVWLDDRKNVYLNSFCFGYRVRDNLDPFYMAYALRSFPVRKQLILLAQGISRYNISKRKAMDVRIHLPQLEEQKAIGSFFKKLDERIAMQEAKVEKLKAMKQAYLHEMFPAEGESVPKRRFAGFTNEWNKQRFGDVLRSHAFNEFLAKPVEYGSFEVIQQGDAPIVGYADGNPYKGFEDIVLFGDHTLSLYKPTRPFFLATDGVKILSGDNIDGSFLYTLIERYKPESQGYKRHFTILKDQICMLTSDREEQQKIGSFFKKLDERIAMQEAKVEKLKAMKSAYLNEMFV